mmetsp:Transcript_16026/g.41152  ORF Transcript_16026/g.41152 Transcript_16026/m.41152 type:complete len:280 (+) Transcript_16026:100-939(+)
MTDFYGSNTGQYDEFEDETAVTGEALDFEDYDAGTYDNTGNTDFGQGNYGTVEQPVTSAPSYGSSSFQKDTVEQDYMDVMDDPGSDSGKVAPDSATSTKPSFVEDEEEDTTKYKCWHVENYRSYFNVDSWEVAHRFLRVVMPLPIGPDFFERFGDNADLYGPFWVSTTLLFLLAAVGNFASWLRYELSSSSNMDSDSAAEIWEYNFFKVLYATIAIYSYVGLMPLAVWGFFKWFDIELSLTNHYMAFGYSLLTYIPAVILCVIPLVPLQWVLIFVAFGF